MRLSYFVFVLLLTKSCYAWFDITRGENDRWKHFSGSCPKHSTHQIMTCTCDDNYSTVMTNQSESYHCSNPGELNCHYSVGKLNQVYIITETSGTREIIQTPDVDGSPTNLLKSIEIWHLKSHRGDDGLWTDITAEASPFFTINKDSSKRVYFSYNYLDIENVWEAHLLKISLNCEKEYCPICFLIKFAGHQNYHTSIEHLKERIIRSQSFISTSALPSSTSSTKAQPIPSIVETALPSPSIVTTAAPTPSIATTGTVSISTKRKIKNVGWILSGSIIGGMAVVSLIIYLVVKKLPARQSKVDVTLSDNDVDVDVADNDEKL